MSVLPVVTVQTEQSWFLRKTIHVYTKIVCPVVVAVPLWRTFSHFMEETNYFDCLRCSLVQVHGSQRSKTNRRSSIHVAECISWYFIVCYLQFCIKFTVFSCFLQCCNTIGLVTGMTCGPWKLCLFGTVSGENRKGTGRPGFSVRVPLTATHHFLYSVTCTIVHKLVDLATCYVFVDSVIIGHLLFYCVIGQLGV